MPVYICPICKNTHARCLGRALAAAIAERARAAALAAAIAERARAAALAGGR